MKKRVLVTVTFFCFLISVAAAQEDEDDTTQKYTTRQVGGLLFDTDEGVAVEQGPGGSVYVKSNREYMQKKFKEIDKHFETLESRIASLESEIAETKKKNKVKSEAPSETAPAEKESGSAGEGTQKEDNVAGEILGRRVFAT